MNLYSILRLVAGGLIALVCCYIGVLVKKRFGSRVAFFQSAGDYARFMKSELALNKSTIPHIRSKFLQGRKGEFEKMLMSGSECGISILKGDEKKEISSFLGESGKASLKEQIAFAEYYAGVFDGRKQVCEKEVKTKGNMYFKLLVLAGLAVLVILA